MAHFAQHSRGTFLPPPLPPKALSLPPYRLERVSLNTHKAAAVRLLWRWLRPTLPSCHLQDHMAARRAQQGPPSALWTAAATGDEAAVRRLLRRGTDLEAGQGAEPGTPLCAAACFGHSSIVELLLRAGASVNAHSSVGVTALHLAAENGHAAVIRRLIAAGANLNACMHGWRFHTASWCSWTWHARSGAGAH